jgi:signal peptidase I
MANKKSSETVGETPSEEEGSDAKKKEGEKRPDGLVEWTKSIFIAVVLFLVLRSFLIQTFVITSGSMEETLLVGDFLMVNRAAIGGRVPLTNIRIPGYSEVRRGDVLVFDPPHEDELKLVKRLIGLPGDTLQMLNRVLYLNGEAQDEPYLKHSDVSDEMHPWMSWQREYLADTVDPMSYAPTRDTWGPLVIPEGNYFMMGDNRETSLDSRYWGLLEEWRLEGRAVFNYFSYNKESYRPFPWIREVRWGRIGGAIR